MRAWLLDLFTQKFIIKYDRVLSNQIKVKQKPKKNTTTILNHKKKKL